VTVDVAPQVDERLQGLIAESFHAGRSFGGGAIGTSLPSHRRDMKFVACYEGSVLQSNALKSMK
jgi:hypothetical protein